MAPPNNPYLSPDFDWNKPSRLPGTHNQNSIGLRMLEFMQRQANKMNDQVKQNAQAMAQSIAAKLPSKPSDLLSGLPSFWKNFLDSLGSLKWMNLGGSNDTRINRATPKPVSIGTDELLGIEKAIENVLPDKPSDMFEGMPSFWRKVIDAPTEMDWSKNEQDQSSFGKDLEKTTDEFSDAVKEFKESIENLFEKPGTFQRVENSSRSVNSFANSTSVSQQMFNALSPIQLASTSNSGPSRAETIKSTSGSMLDKPPSGSESDPVFIRIKEGFEYSKKEKTEEKSVFEKAFSSIGGNIIGKITGGVLGSIVSKGVLGSILSKSTGGSIAKAATAAVAGTGLSGLFSKSTSKLPDVVSPNSSTAQPLSTPDTSSSKSTIEPNKSTIARAPAKKGLSSILKTAGRGLLTAARVGTKFLGPLGLAAGLALEGVMALGSSILSNNSVNQTDSSNSINNTDNANNLSDVSNNTQYSTINPELHEKNIQLAESQLNKAESNFNQSIFTGKSILSPNLVQSTSPSLFVQSPNPEAGHISEAKGLARASLGTQTNQATNTRIQQNQTQRQNDMMVYNQSHQVINNNYSTTIRQNKVIQIDNPQGRLVHGTR